MTHTLAAATTRQHTSSPWAGQPARVAPLQNRRASTLSSEPPPIPRPAPLLSSTSSEASSPDEMPTWLTSTGVRRKSGVPRPAAATTQPSVELLWLDSRFARAVAATPAFKPYLPEPTKPKRSFDSKVGPGSGPENKARAARDARRRVISVLVKAPSSRASELQPALHQALSQGADLTPPLKLLAGTMTPSFDELQELEVTADIARTIAPANKPLQSTLEMVDRTLETSLKDSTEVTQGLTARLRYEWRQAGRELPDGYLERNTASLLLKRRVYRKCELMGSAFIRTEITINNERIPAYLPAELANRLPLFHFFNVRVIAQVMPRQDQQEQAPVALRIVALGRLLDPPSGSAALARL